MKAVLLQLLLPDLPEVLDLSGAALSQVGTLARQWNVSALVYCRLREYSRRHPDDEGLSRFLRDGRMEFFAGIGQSMRQEAAAADSLRVLHERGIPAIVVKGAAIAAELYGSTDARVSCDIDILIRQQDALRADAAFREAGYAPVDPEPVEFLLLRRHHVSYRQANGLYIEVHWNFSIPGLFNLPSDEIWQDVTTAREDRPRLTSEMTVIMLLLHHHIHFFRDRRILVDILWALQKYRDGISWPRFALRLQRIGLVKTARLALAQIQRLWGPDAEALAPILQLDELLCASGLSAPRCVQRQVLAAVEGPSEAPGLRDRVGFRLTLDRRSTVLFSFLKTIWPQPGALAALYPEAGRGMLWLSYARYMRRRWGHHRKQISVPTTQ